MHADSRSNEQAPGQPSSQMLRLAQTALMALMVLCQATPLTGGQTCYDGYVEALWRLAHGWPAKEITKSKAGG